MLLKVNVVHVKQCITLLSNTKAVHIVHFAKKFEKLIIKNFCFFQLDNQKYTDIVFFIEKNKKTGQDLLYEGESKSNAIFFVWPISKIQNATKQIIHQI